jgi:hypothetical protein
MRESYLSVVEADEWPNKGLLVARSKATSFHLSTEESSFLFQREDQPLQTSGRTPHLGDSPATSKAS